MNAIDTTKFYNCDIIAKESSIKNNPNSKPCWVKESRKMPSHILGPPQFWMEFDKQVDALSTASKESNKGDALCVFVYQDQNGYRKFVVAHPEMYWWHYEHRSPDQRCSYELIPEHSPCRLYLDLEFPKELNQQSDGPSMTNTVIDIFCAYLLLRWSLPCNKYDVLNLDSSTEEKFSRHLIFNVKGIAFADNYHVGRFVKSICKDIANHLSNKVQHDVLNCFERQKLEELFVETKRDKRIFIDTGVYTKNRHFRIYKSTKWGKKSNLVVSEDCKYILSTLYSDRELNLFLDSLISYFVNHRDLVLLEYSDAGATEAKRFPKVTKNSCEEATCSSQFPALDKYVQTLVAPGKIRLCKYFQSVKVLVYETVGYRYCENIRRCHKSNNVFWIVDLRSKTVSQKCHDEDCFGFRSELKPLPDEICFHIDDEDDLLLSCAVVTEDI